MPDHCVCVCVCVCVCMWVRAGGSVECMTDFQHLGSFVFREDRLPILQSNLVLCSKRASSTGMVFFKDPSFSCLSPVC